MLVLKEMCLHNKPLQLEFSLLRHLHHWCSPQFSPGVSAIFGRHLAHPEPRTARNCRLALRVGLAPCLNEIPPEVPVNQNKFTFCT